MAQTISEYSTAYFIQNYIVKNSIFPVLKDVHMIKNQRDRINLLDRLKIIDNDDKMYLELINEIRDTYLHVRDTQSEKTREESLKVITALNKLLTKHSIVLT